MLNYRVGNYENFQYEKIVVSGEGIRTGFQGPTWNCGHTNFVLHSWLVGPFGPTFCRHRLSSTTVGIPPETTCSHLISLVCSPPLPQSLLQGPHSPSTHTGGHGSSLQACVSAGSNSGSQRLSSTGWLSLLRTQATRLD